MPVEMRPQKVEPRPPSSLSRLVEEYFMDVYSLSLRILGRPHDAEDATQETFLALFRSKDKLDQAGSARAWVLAVARNTAISLFRTRRRARPWLEESGDVAAPVPDPADRDKLHEALAGLTEEERHLVQLRFLEGRTPTEMAAASGRKPGAVATALCRAMNRLRSLYHGGAR